MDIHEIAGKFPPRGRALLKLVEERIVVFDGATGTRLQGAGLTAEDFGGAAHDGCLENLARTRPDLVARLHASYFEAGADIVETDTFGATPLVLAEYGLREQAREISAAAARLARRVAEKYSTPDRPRFVAGGVGPTTKALSVTGGATYSEMLAAYVEQLRGLLEGGADCLLFETVQDGLNLKAAFDAADLVFDEAGTSLPTAVSVTIEPSGTMLAGQDVEALYVSVRHRPLLFLGLNCATGPAFMSDHLRTLAKISHIPTSCMPNAGLPDEEGCYSETPETLAAKLGEFVAQGRLNVVGGCCGTTPEYIRRLAETVAGRPPRRPSGSRRTVVSGIEAVEIHDGNRPVLIGERTNSLGSRAFRRLISEEKFDEAAEVGREQVRAGAHLLDVNLQNPDRDERADMARFLDLLVKKIKAPLVIDTTDLVVLAEALKHCQGKVVYNSVNLEEGEEKFARVAPLYHKYGLALIVGCIDEDKEQAQAVSRQRKLAVAERSHELLTGKYGVREEDIIFDPLVFPCGTGDAAYRGSARETVEGVRLIKQRFPRCKTTLGISNVSFGLPPAGRPVLNSVFLHHCVEAGLDAPIVNSKKLIRYPQIPAADRRVCEDLMDDVGDDPVTAFAAHFRGRREEASADERLKLPVEERLRRAVVEGVKEHLPADLEALLRTRRPLKIVNGPLSAGMDEVGRLFNRNELIVAEVLQSAEVMKAAVSFLEPYMEKTETSVRGKMLLATVKGDVHDIGKSLVEIILSNNGFEVVNLGIKVPPEKLIAAVREHSPDLVGLSGLLVKSAHQMAATAADLRAAGVSVPLLVGGAALSDKFTRTRIAPAYGAPVFYAKDAMEGLELARIAVNPEKLRALTAAREDGPEKGTTAGATAAASAVPAEAREEIRHDFPPPPPPDLLPHVVDDCGPDEVFRRVNPLMLYGKHLGLRGDPEKLWAAGDERALKLKRTVETVLKNAGREGLLRPKGVYRFYVAAGEGDALLLFESEAAWREAVAGATGKETVRFVFPRQATGRGRCLSDFVRPLRDGVPDYAAMFVVTCGHGATEKAAEYKRAGRYLESHVLAATALECAEGFAELLHARLRRLWGFPDPPELTLKDIFKARYRGARLSFGYPACPRLEDQRLLFRALRPERLIGVELTEECMMSPEGSVSALVFHHPQARYFRVDEEGLRRFEESRR